MIFNPDFLRNSSTEYFELALASNSKILCFYDSKILVDNLFRKTIYNDPLQPKISLWYDDDIWDISLQDFPTKDIMGFQTLLFPYLNTYDYLLKIF